MVRKHFQGFSTSLRDARVVNKKPVDPPYHTQRLKVSDHSH